MSCTAITTPTLSPEWTLMIIAPKVLRLMPRIGLVYSASGNVSHPRLNIETSDVSKILPLNKIGMTMISKLLNSPAGGAEGPRALGPAPVPAPICYAQASCLGRLTHLRKDC